MSKIPKPIYQDANGKIISEAKFKLLEEKIRTTCQYCPKKIERDTLTCDFHKFKDMEIKTLQDEEFNKLFESLSKNEQKLLLIEQRWDEMADIYENSGQEIEDLTKGFIMLGEMIDFLNNQEADVTDIQIKNLSKCLLELSQKMQNEYGIVY